MSFVPAESQIGAAPEARLGDYPPERRNGAPRGMVPSTWLGRSVRLEYSGAYGPTETSGTLLDFCGLGAVFALAGARVLVPWDRLCTIELKED